MRDEWQLCSRDHIHSSKAEAKLCDVRPRVAAPATSPAGDGSHLSGARVVFVVALAVLMLAVLGAALALAAPGARPSEVVGTPWTYEPPGPSGGVR